MKKSTRHPSVARVPWGAWHGDRLRALRVPSSWRVQVCAPAGGADIGADGIEAALDAPVGAPLLEYLARGRRRVVLIVEDISRPAPVARLIRPLLRRLAAGGAGPSAVCVVFATGLHRRMTRIDAAKKLGHDAARRLAWFCHDPHRGLVRRPATRRGTPVWVSRRVAEADLRIGIGSVAPHPDPGFGGGAKIVAPGVAGYATTAALHDVGFPGGGIGRVDGNAWRREVEEIAIRRVGLDWIVNVVPGPRREVAGLFAGHAVAAHRAAVACARRVFATALPRALADIAFCNAYPKDTEFLHAAHAASPLRSAARHVVREGGTVVVLSACSEGYGQHELFGRGMRYDAFPPGSLAPDELEAALGVKVLRFAPGLGAADARRVGAYREWGALVLALAARHPDSPRVAVFPCGSIQLADT